MTEWLHFHFSLSCIGEGNGNPLQCSCLENPRDWWLPFVGLHRVGHDWSDLAAAAANVYCSTPSVSQSAFVGHSRDMAQLQIICITAILKSAYCSQKVVLWINILEVFSWTNATPQPWLIFIMYSWAVVIGQVSCLWYYDLALKHLWHIHKDLVLQKFWCFGLYTHFQKWLSCFMYLLLESLILQAKSAKACRGTTMTMRIQFSSEVSFHVLK